MVKKHYYELDRLNVLLCLIVVFIHAFGGVAGRLNQDSWRRTFFGSILFLK